MPHSTTTEICQVLHRGNFRQPLYHIVSLILRPVVHSLTVLSYDLFSGSDPARSEHSISLTVSGKSGRFVSVPRNYGTKIRELTVNQIQTLKDSGLFEVECSVHQKT